MLENIDQVDWQGLGNPSIPRWLESLTSVDENIRNRAIYQLSVDVVMDDMVYDGNMKPTIPLSSDVFVQVVPFLLELLNYRSISCKSSILSLLNSIVWFHIRFQDNAGKLGLTKEHLDRASNAFQLILASKQTLMNLLTYPDEMVNQSAKQLLDALAMPLPKD